MNVRLYDGTVRCADHMDASSYQGVTEEHCLYCPPVGDTFAPWEVEIIDKTVGVSLVKRSDTCPLPYESSAVAQRPSRTPWYPLVGHREGLRRNDPSTLASAFWILAWSGGAAHPLSPTPGTVVNGKVTPVRF